VVNDELKAVFANTGTEVVEIQRLSLSSALIELSSLDDAVKAVVASHNTELKGERLQATFSLTLIQ